MKPSRCKRHSAVSFFNGRQFEQCLGKSKELPKVDSSVEFLNQMNYKLEASQYDTNGVNRSLNPLGIGHKSWEVSQKVVNSSGYGVQGTQGAGQRANPSKNVCKNRCAKHGNFSVNGKFNEVREHKVCSKCLTTGHCQRACESSCSCKTCNHSLHHGEKVLQKTVLVDSDENDETPFSTAKVEVKYGNDHWVSCRVLLHCGSMANFISKEYEIKLYLNNFQILRQTVLKAVVMDNFVSNVLATERPETSMCNKPKQIGVQGLCNQFRIMLANERETFLTEGKFTNDKKLLTKSEFKPNSRQSVSSFSNISKRLNSINLMKFNDSSGKKFTMKFEIT